MCTLFELAMARVIPFIILTISLIREITLRITLHLNFIHKTCLKVTNLLKITHTARKSTEAHFVIAKTFFSR